MNLKEILGKNLLFFDGAMGTLLQAQGLKAGELPELWNIRCPEKITAIHQSYRDAGADIILTNTFGANALKLEGSGVSPAEAVRAAIACVKRTEGGRPCFCALDIGPTGKLLHPLGDLSFEGAYTLFKEIVLAAEGADLICIETMSDTYELKAAVLAAKENSCLPVFATAVFDEQHRMLTGGDVRGLVALLEGLGVDALGVNCSLGPKQMLPLVREVLRYASVPVIASPNAGLPRSENGRTVYDTSAGEFAALMKQIALEGAWVLGGCCGTTPEYIRTLTSLCGEIPPKKQSPKNHTLISSYARSLEIGAAPLVIGERINPTGKTRFKRALLEHDIDYILNEGFLQADAGADILDVNVGLPGVDEAEMMGKLIPALQAVLDLPLQIDSSFIPALERALRLYNGKALLNSVNGKEESMQEVFPLVKKYGAAVVALALDEKGIPETAEGRLAVAEKIVRRARDFGITPKDIVVDVLCLTVSSEPSAPQTALNAIKMVKERLGLRTVLGVSNVSFGLPARETINAAYTLLALQSGLDAAIINPNSAPVMDAFRAYRVLSGCDEHCADYIARYGGVTLPAAVSDSLPLSVSVENGLKEQARRAALEELKSMPPLELVNTVLIPALDKVGRGFEQGRLFLPQLLMSAEAAKAAFTVVKDALSKTGALQEKRGKIILATVKGDIHDIGKNIVKVLLDNYGYEVLDLGKDISAEEILACALEYRVPLVGLSALMTTTVVHMEETIELFRKKFPECRIMAGGAVLTPDYARKIGAHFYAKDAMAGVDYAKQVFA